METVTTHASLKAKDIDKSESQSDEWASCEKGYFTTPELSKSMFSKETNKQTSEIAPDAQNRSNADVLKLRKTASKTSVKSQPDTTVRTFSSIQIPESEPSSAKLKPDCNQDLEGNFPIIILYIQLHELFFLCKVISIQNLTAPHNSRQVE